MTVLSHTDEEAIRETLMGHSVVSVEWFETPVSMKEAYDNSARGKLVLDDGTELFIIPNIGGCSCSAGDYDLTSLERVDNIITRVDFEIDNSETDEYGEGEQTYQIFVLAGHEQINLLSVHGDDGNGYYGTGYELVVRKGSR